MTLLSDENLMAYVDEELDEATAKQIEAALRDSPEAREKLRVFQESAQALRAYDGVLQEEIPAPIQAVLGKEPGGSGSSSINAGANNKVTPLHGKRDTPRFSPHLALAASVVLMMGFFVGTMLDTTGPVGSSGSSPLVQLLPDTLDGNMSGEPSAVLQQSGENATTEHIVMPLETFDTDSGICRSFEYMRLPGDAQLGVACLNPAGDWELKMLVPDSLAVEARSGEIPGGYQPASGGKALLQAFKTQQSGLQVLSSEDEQDLIKHRWQK